MAGTRGVSSVVGTVLLVAIVIVLTASIGAFYVTLVDETTDTTGRPIPASDNLLTNPSFADGLVGWDEKEWYEGDVEPGAGHQGGDALRLPPDSYRAQNVTAVIDSGGDYRVCGWSRLVDESTPAEAWIGVQFYDEPGEYAESSITEKYYWRVSWTDYREQCVYFSAPEEFGEAHLLVSTDGGHVDADDLSLVETRYITE